MLLWVMTHSFYFMLCQSSLLSTVINFVYKDKWWFDKSISVIFCMENTWKRILLFPPHTNFSWIKLENFVMQLKRHPAEAWQNEKHYSKENNISKNPIPRREIFKSVDHVKYEGQAVTTFVVCAVFSLIFQAVVLLTKTSINHCFFFNLVWGEWMDLRNSNGIELVNFYFTTV